MNKILKFFISLISWISVIILILIIVFLFVSGQNLFSYKPYIIQSGSMEPSIMTGDVVLVKKQNTYSLNDVVTFKNNNRVSTHRIIEENNDLFVTKGDANQIKDSEEIKSNQIFGKVVMTLPKLGYIVSFGRSPKGFFLLFFIPGIIIVFNEFKNIKKAFEKS